MKKGDRVRHRYFRWEGYIAGEIDPFDPVILIKWDQMGGITDHGPNEFVVIPPLQQLAECAE
jgi:hypothetical protein